MAVSGSNYLAKITSPAGWKTHFDYYAETNELAHDHLTYLLDTDLADEWASEVGCRKHEMKVVWKRIGAIHWKAL